MWKRSNRKRIKEVYGILFHKNIDSNCKIPEIDIGDLVQDNLNIQVSNLKIKDGNVSHLEHLVIALLVKHNDPKKIFEIGTFDGRSTFKYGNQCTECRDLYP